MPKPLYFFLFALVIQLTGTALAKGERRPIPVDVIGPGVFEPVSVKEKNRQLNEYSHIETVVLRANGLSKSGSYSQTESSFKRAIFLFDQAERKDPRSISLHSLDKAECLEEYAKLLQKQNRFAESLQIQGRALKLRQAAASTKAKIRSYSNGYTRVEDLPAGPHP